MKSMSFFIATLLSWPDHFNSQFVIQYHYSPLFPLFSYCFHIISNLIHELSYNFWICQSHIINTKLKTWNFIIENLAPLNTLIKKHYSIMNQIDRKARIWCTKLVSSYKQVKSVDNLLITLKIHKEIKLRKNLASRSYK